MRRRSTQPGTSLISAFADDETLHRAQLLGVSVVLAKPFRVEELIAEVERVLAGHA